MENAEGTNTKKRLIRKNQQMSRLQLFTSPGT